MEKIKKIKFDNLINENYHDNNLQKNRLIFILIILFLLFLVLSVRLLFLSKFAPTNNISLNDLLNPLINTKRNNIVDKNGIILASDIKLVNFYLNRQLISNPKKTSEDIVKIIPELNQEKLLKRLINAKSNSKYILIKRNITPIQQELIRQKGILGFEFFDSIGRIYPHKNLFSHIVGYVDIDRKGIAGLEKQYNNYLTEELNPALMLTFDIRIQSILRNKLLKGLQQYQAKSAIGIVMEIKTGNLLAVVSLPDFDPNQLNLYSDNSLYNRATFGVYEMGSISKIFTIAEALDKNIIKETDVFDVSQVIKYGNYELQQKYYTKKFMNPDEILSRSSNIGAALIALKLGNERMRDFLEKIGMFERIPANFTSLARPLVPKIWRDITTITASYGHGISVTPLHTAMATAGVVNNGNMNIPRFSILDDYNQKKIISERTSKIMNLYLRNVVKAGTGWRSNVLGYSVGGKTGSARLLNNGIYEEGNIMANFIGIFPMNNPHFLVYVMIESPNTKEKNEDVSSATITAPIVGDIIENIAPILNVVPYIEN